MWSFAPHTKMKCNLDHANVRRWTWSEQAIPTPHSPGDAFVPPKEQWSMNTSIMTMHMTGKL